MNAGVAARRNGWGRRFLRALGRFTDPARLARGRDLSARVGELSLDDGKLWAVVEDPEMQSSRRAWLGLAAPDETVWPPLLAELGGRTRLLPSLLLNELSDEVLELTAGYGVTLLPCGPRDLSTGCDCADYFNPCWHQAALCYRLAEQLDDDPLLLFELRGLTREALRAALRQTPLGVALAAGLVGAADPVTSFAADGGYYPPVGPGKAVADYQDYWFGNPTPADPATAPTPPPVSGVVLKRGGERPPFWPQRRAFTEVMDELYERLRKHYRDIL